MSRELESATHRSADRALSWLILGVFFAAWELAVRVHFVSATFLPPPTQIVAALAKGLWQGAMLENLRVTLVRVALGLGVGGGLGLVLGLAMGWSERVRAVIDPLIAALHPVPKLALLPLFMVFFGLNEAPKVIVIGAAALFPMLLNAAAGVRQISPVHFDVARNYGASRRQMLTRVVLPGSVPMVLTGLRLAGNVAFLSAIAVEMVGARTGLGATLWFAWQTLRVDLLFATLTLIALIGVSLNLAFRRLARRGAPWLTEREVAI
jgi:NitT/TauT family transport system permease protein